MGSMTPQLRGLGMSPLATAGNIELTPLNFVPGARMKRYLGPITLHFIKESSQVREVRKRSQLLPELPPTDDDTAQLLTHPPTVSLLRHLNALGAPLCIPSLTCHDPRVLVWCRAAGWGCFSSCS